MLRRRPESGRAPHDNVQQRIQYFKYKSLIKTLVLPLNHRGSQSGLMQSRMASGFAP